MTRRDVIATDSVPQLIWGKLVAGPHGATVSDPHLREYRVTGRSRSFPEALVHACHPRSLGLGADAGFDWAHWPWRADGGGIVAAVRRDDGTPRLVAGRITVCSEGGTGAVAGRSYQQAQYVALAPRLWRPTTPLTLVATLRAEPMTSIDLALPDLPWPRLPVDAPLPARWLEQAAISVPILLSGCPIALQDHTQSLPEAALAIAIVLACLPTALAWRVGFGLGVVSLHEACGVGVVMRALTDSRVVSGELHQDRFVDLTVGNRWLDFLTTTTASAGTLTELASRISEAWPLFATWDAIQPALEWRDSVAVVSQALEDRRRVYALATYVASPSGPMPALPEGADRAAALALMLDNAGLPDASSWNAVMSPEWRPAWSLLARQADATGHVARGVGRLLGFVDAMPGDALDTDPTRVWQVLAGWLPGSCWDPPESWFATLLRLRVDRLLLADDTDRGARLDRWLAERCGQPAAGLLLGMNAPPSSHARYRDCALNEVAARAVADEQLLWRLLDPMLGSPVDEGSGWAIARAWSRAIGARPVSARASLLRMLLASSPPERWPDDLDGAALHAVARVCRRIGLEATTTRLGDTARTFAELRFAVETALPTSPPPRPEPWLFAGVLRERLRDRVAAAAWLRPITLRRWHAAPLWRLMTCDLVDELDSDEVATLRLLHRWEVLTLIGLGLTALPPGLLTDVTAHDVACWSPTLDELALAVELALSPGHEELRSSLRHYTSERATPRDDALAPRSLIRGVIDRIRRPQARSWSTFAALLDGRRR